jgi:hypothetical protein
LRTEAGETHEESVAATRGCFMRKPGNSRWLFPPPGNLMAGGDSRSLAAW